MESRRAPLYVLTGIAAGFCLAVAIALLALSSLPYAGIRAALVAMAGDSLASRFTPVMHSNFVLGARLMTVCLVAVSLMLAVAARWVTSRIEIAGSSLGQVGTEMAQSVRSLRTESRAHIAALAAIILWAVGIRCVYLFEPMRYDEGYTFLSYASRPLVIGISYLTSNNHILNTALMHASYVVFGDAPWALRIPVLIAGIAIVPLTYAVVREYVNKNAALLAAALVSSSFPLIEYSTNARGYTLGTAFLLGMILFVLLARRTSGAWMPAAVCGALALYSVSTMTFGVAGVLLWAVATTRSLRVPVRVAAGTAILTGMLYVPVVATGGFSAFINSPWLERLSLTSTLRAIPRSAGFLWIYWNMRLPIALSVLIVLGVALSVFAALSRRPGPVSILVFTVFVSLAMLTVQRFDPPRRVWLFLTPIFLASAAQGWEFLSRRFHRVRAAIPAIAVAICLWMGVAVLRGGGLYRPGGEEFGFHNAEEYGFPNAEQFVRDQKSPLLHGATMVYKDPHDVPIQYAMYRLGIPYKPLPGAELLIITRPGAAPRSAVAEDGPIPANEIQVGEKIASYPWADVYIGRRIGETESTARVVPAGSSAGR